MKPAEPEQEARRHMRTFNHPVDRLELIRHKDGISVWRVFGPAGTAVLKMFQRPSDCREIDMYGILRRLGLQTIPVLAVSDDALLLADMAASDRFRLGTAEDMNDADVAAVLAGWYRNLHAAGRAIVAAEGESLYGEIDQLTPEALRHVQEVTATHHSPLWPTLSLSLEHLLDLYGRLPQTLTYNDFYYTNLIVAKDKSAAFMFDYHLTGRGLAGSDIENVTCQLSPAARTAFLQTYGRVDAFEKAVCDVCGHLVALVEASRREVFPAWAEPSRQRLADGRLLEDLTALPLTDA